ncbi:lamin tail domain-containing protein [Phycicoccus avicenniae]|uniref:lamin tail domain-containing protein n=1 Tax=Phycicoccus avicenniae TaxID=2828860 RepID=UPI003D266099
MRTLVALGVAAVAALAAATPAVSASVSQQGTVVAVVDGDTVDVDIDGDGTSRPVAIRNAGLQTMETGQCHAADATAVMRSVALGQRVRLTAASSSSSSLGRPVRTVDVIGPSGTTDTQLEVLRRGQALPFPMGFEQARSASYLLAAEQAAAAGTGLWDDDTCGAGPAEGARLRVMVMYEGDGDEAKNPNAEWVDIRNDASSAVSLAGWWLRSAAQDSKVFPAGTAVAPRSVLRVHVGKGTPDAVHAYWGFTAPRFNNITATQRVGGGAYLFDPQGDLRAHSSYPCLTGTCLTPAARGKVTLTARYDAPGDDMTNPNGEVVTITSTTTARVDLSFAVLQVGGNTLQLGSTAALPTKGSTIRVYMGKGTTTATVKHWNHPSSILANAGGAVELRTHEAVRIACTAWGTGRC